MLDIHDEVSMYFDDQAMNELIVSSKHANFAVVRNKGALLTFTIEMQTLLLFKIKVQYSHSHLRCKLNNMLDLKLSHELLRLDQLNQQHPLLQPHHCLTNPTTCITCINL